MTAWINCSNIRLLFRSQVELQPFTRYKGLDWAPLNSARRLRRTQAKFFYLMKFAYYLSGRVRHQFTDDFSIPLPPPEEWRRGR